MESTILQSAGFAAYYKETGYTRAQINDMREWVKDCNWREEYEPEEIDALTDNTILRGIENNFDGGLIAFIACI